MLDAPLVLQIPCGANRAQTKNKNNNIEAQLLLFLYRSFSFVWQINRFTRLHRLHRFETEPHYAMQRMAHAFYATRTPTHFFDLKGENFW